MSTETTNDKKATTRFPLHDLLAGRWSPRAFAERMVEAEALGSLFEAARWAPSCFNEQPWAFVVGTRGDDGTYEKLEDALVPANQAWASGAPVLVLAATRGTFSRNGKPNAHARYDLGAAVALLTVQAEALGLSVHQMAGFDPETARANLAIPDDYEPVTMFAIGYQGDPSGLPEELANAERGERQRRPLEETVFGSTWGEGLALTEEG